MVVEDKDFAYGADGCPKQECSTPKAATAEDKIVKPIIVPSGVGKPVTTTHTPVSVDPPTPIVVPVGSAKPETAVKAPKVPKLEPIKVPEAEPMTISEKDITVKVKDDLFTLEHTVDASDDFDNKADFTKLLEVPK